MGELSSIKSSITQFAGMMRNVQPVEPEPAPRICTICGNFVSPLLTITGRYVVRRCVCERDLDRQKKEAEEHKALMRRMAEHTYHGWLGEEWKNLNMVRELSTKTFENYDAARQDEYKRLNANYNYLLKNPGNTPTEVLAKMEKSIVSFPEWRRTWRNALEQAQAFAADPRGVILFGGPFGLGKTHLLAAICNALRHRTPAVSSLFVVTPKFFSVYYERMNDKHDEWVILQQACTTKLLVFDDLDKLGPKEFRQEIFFQIIDERITSRLPIAISTNKMESLQAYIGEAAYSRLMSGCTSVELAGRDYRVSLNRTRG